MSYNPNTSRVGGAFAAHAKSPQRLRDVVRLGAAAGLAGAEPADAIDAIEDAIWADGLLPADRPSQRRAWRIVRDAALEAYEDPVGATEEARQRAYHAAAGHIRRLPIGATIEDLADRLQRTEPLIDGPTSREVARKIVARLACPPSTQFGPHASDPFGTVLVHTSANALAIHEKASAMLRSGLAAHMDSLVTFKRARAAAVAR